MNPARSHIALAADVSLEEAVRLYARVKPFVGTVKVGLSLFVEHGPAAVRRFNEEGAQVFLDLKLHDIPNTVELAAARAASLGISFLTVHAQGGPAMLQAAVRGAAEGAAKAGVAPPRILAVTLLTALSAEDVWSIGYSASTEDLVLRLGTLAVQSGVTGLVCSPHEARALRKALGSDVFLCTPGIRFDDSAAGDQSRAQTPAFAMKAGADLLVIGRPIYSATDPVKAAERVCDEMIPR